MHNAQLTIESFTVELLGPAFVEVALFSMISTVEQ